MSFKPAPQATGKAAHAAVSSRAPHGPATDLLGNPGFPQACFIACRTPYDCLWLGCSVLLSQDTIARQLHQFRKSAYVAPDWDPA
jgi:hypothetical protein